MIEVDGEVIADLLLIAGRAGSLILIWMVAMVVLVLRKRRRTKVNGKR